MVGVQLIYSLFLLVFLLSEAEFKKCRKRNLFSDKNLRIDGCRRRDLTLDEWNLLLLHNNDMHSRFVETDAKQNECPDDLKKQNKCYGGFARTATVVRNARTVARSGGTPVLFLNAGDTFAGTPWFMVHKWPLVVKGLNMLKPDAMSLGNHEFDLGAEGLSGLVHNVRFPVLATNIDVSQEPNITNADNFKRSQVFTVRGNKVGVIGYVLPGTKLMATANNVTFHDEIIDIRKEIQKLKEEGIKIFIALGHSGFEMDKKIAEEVEDIDVVIGGHTNTFLWTGEPPDSEKSKGPYPVVVEQKSGRKVPVVQAFAHTKYMGRLLVTFGADGEVRAFCGQPLLLDGSIPQARDVERAMRCYKSSVDKVVNEIVGEVPTLSVQDCRKRECDIGNLVAQSMLEVATNNTKPKEAVLVLVNSGSIRSDLEPNSKGEVTRGAVMTTLPYENMVFRCNISGKLLKEALEWGVTRYKKNNTFGEFPQVANMRVTIDFSKEVGKRLKIRVKCVTCTKGYTSLKPSSIYTLITLGYVLQGGDGYEVLKSDKISKENLGIIDSVAVSEYLKNHRSITDDTLKKLRGNIVIKKELE